MFFQAINLSFLEFYIMSPASPAIIKQVREAIAAWPDFARAARVSEVETNRISQYHSLIPS